jgi:hypothetical protein
MYRLSKGLARAFKNSSSIARYSDAGGDAQPLVGGIPVDPLSVQIADRAREIMLAATNGMDYGTALKMARKEIADQAEAEEDGTDFGEGVGSLPHAHSYGMCGKDMQTGEIIDPEEAAIQGRAGEMIQHGAYQGDWEGALAAARQENADAMLSAHRGGTLGDPHHIEMVNRAKQIMASKGWDKSKFGAALQIVRKEKFEKHLAAEKALDNAALKFYENRGLRVDLASVRVERRALQILRENKWSHTQFGEALKQAYRDVE